MRPTLAILILGATLIPLSVLAEPASATGFVCSPTTTSQSGTTSTQCLLFVYEGDFLLCAGGRHDVIPDPDWTRPREEYECFTQV